MVTEKVIESGTEMGTLTMLEQLKNGKISCADHVQAQLEKTRKENKTINAFLYVAEKEALARANELDAKRKSKAKLGRLFGLTLGIKANINVIGMPISCASKTLAEYNGTYHADVIEKILSEDGIILGMTNMDEFACGISGETSAFGSIINPRSPKHVPGGSSAGSAAAVAAGFCDLALGSDTGGSIRNPVSHCGIVGIKPSYGRVSRYGLIDLSMSLDQIGPCSSDVYGAALLLEVISGHSDNDPMTYDKPVPLLTTSQATSAKKPKSIALSPAFASLCTDKRIYHLVKEKVHDIAKACKILVKEIDLKHVELAVQAYYPIVYTEFFSGTRRFEGRRYGKKIEEACKEEVLRRSIGGRIISCAEYEGRYYRKALQVKRAIQKEFEKAFREVDIVALPVTPELPHLLGNLPSAEAAYAYDAFTIPASLAGICAGVVPCGELDNVPVGLQFCAGAFQEEMLVNAMRLMEKD